MKSVNSSEYVRPSRIIAIQFGQSSPESIIKNSVVQIESRDTYINNKPVVGGLFDPRMGVLEPGLICPTDGLTYIDTPGYFGHILLSRPVFFIQHIKEIMNIMKCICFKCSKLRANKKQHQHILNWSASERWSYICPLASSIKRCGDSIEDGCGCKQPDKIKMEGMATLYAVWENISTANADGTSEKKTVNMRLTPEMIIKIFRRISDDDITFMGFSPIWSRPEWMVCSVLPVPPPAVRPSVKHDAQQRSEDDLTHIYSNIIKTNKDLSDKIHNNASPNVIEGLTSVLQYLVAMIVNNKIKGAVPMAQRSGRPLQCISGRLNSKNGRIRGNLMGKRVDFSARSVITGDPNLSIRQLGVPKKIAMNITKPVIVNDRNRDFLLKLIQNGPDEYPGAKILERRNGDSISLRYVDRNSIVLENGDVVHRHMMDGDYVLFNRQPSLHRMSMMCHEVKVMQVGDTFRMNVGDTKPYNADFDGDEMNMHMPQNILAETELRHLAAIPYQMISPSGNSPIIGIYQDSLLGSYRFTRKEIPLTPRDAMNLLMMFNGVDVAKLYANRKSLTNFDILSQILPPLTLKYKTKLFKDGEDFGTSNNVLDIFNGTYNRGQLEKSVLASTSKGILHRIYNDFGHMAASNFVDDLQNVVTEYMKSSSFSVGISDLIANKKTQDAIIQVVNTQKLEVQAIIEKVHLGIFKNETAATNAAEFETQVNNILNKATEQAGKIGRESLSKDNRFLMIVESGSKGSLVNISQMISCLGQQNVDGKRIPYGFDSRTLPHYKKFDDSPAARGFIENSYISGLTAPQVFAHAMGGRIGLIDTAVKTSQTGYIQRRLIKALEDIQMEYDGTVRNSKKVVVQFRYGDDGMDSTKTENQIIPLVGMSLEDIYMHYDIPGLTDGEKSSARDVYTKATLSRMGRQREKTVEMCKKYIAMMIDARDGIVTSVFAHKNENTVKVPVAFQYIIANIQGQLNLGPNSTVDITPLEAFQMVEEGFEVLKHIHYTQPTELFKILYYYYLSPKDILFNKRYHKKGLELLIETIHLKYKQSIVHPGEMVGVVAGQSIGEPTTQLTLNSVIYETEILVRNSKKEIQRVRIGEFIEEQIQKSAKIDYTEDKDTTYAELNPAVEYYEVPSATESGNTVWRRIEAVTRHPVINEDGTDTMLKVKTKGCREVVATKAKSFLQLIDGKIIGVNGKDLKVGDYLPVSKVAIICPLDGSNDDVYGNSSASASDNWFTHARIPEYIQFSPVKSLRVQFLWSYIKDYSYTMSERPLKLNISSKSYDFSVDFIVLLKNLGITGKMQEDNSIIVENEDAQLLEKTVGFNTDFEESPETQEPETDEQIPNIIDGITVMQLRESRTPDLIFDQITSIEEIANTTNYAYDLTVEDTRNFDIYNGLCLRDTFHLAGVASKSNVTRGVPRIEEILRLTKNQKNPSLTVHLHPFDETDRNKASSYANMLEHTKLVDVVKSVQIYFDPIENSTFLQEDKELIEKFYEFDRMIGECINGEPVESQNNNDIRGGGGQAAIALTQTNANNGPEKSKWIIRMNFDAEILLDRNITMDDIHFAITNTYGDEVSCTYSDFNHANLVFRIRLNSSVFDKSKKKRGQVESLDQSDEIYLLRNFQDALLKNIVLRGVSGISNVIPRKLQNMVIKNDGKYLNKDVWILDTTGSNLMAVLAMDYIDSTRTYSNNIREIFDVLGIEAARQIIYNELIEVMEFADVYINYHHVSLLCDRMTMLENMVPIFRSGIFSDDIGPIAKATYEVHTEVFLDAARHAEIDHMRGVSANVMCGQYGNYGTNAFNLVLDMEEMSKLKEAVMVIKDENKEIEELFKLAGEDEGDACSKMNLTIENHIEAIRNDSRANICNDNYDMGF